MRSVPKWIEKIHENEKAGNEASIYSICYHPEGIQLVVGAFDKVLVYDPEDGTLKHSLTGHKSTVYAVTYSGDGKKFASGSADKSVIIWTNKMEGLLKYSHADALQCLAFNPVSFQLASCSISDFAFWSPEQKAVQKHKISTRINACAWTNDGQFLALGLANGTVSLRNKAGEEKGKIERGTAPIYGLAWNPTVAAAAATNAANASDVLVVADWNQTLAFYTPTGQPVGKERNLGFDPLCVQYFPCGEYLVVAGCNKTMQLFSRDGVRLGQLGEQHNSWIWTVAVHPQGNAIAIGCQDGTLAYYSLAFSTVHALYRERYAFRENMCDVIIQHLLSNQKVRIKCRDLVHKIAIYKNRLAVQLPERVVLYELSSAENEPMHYRVKEKIAKKFDCSLLVVCAQHLVLCQETKLQSLDFAGVLQREWALDSFIRYIKVTGGPSGREGLFLGLKNGQVWRIFLDNPLPILVTTVLSSVRCLDLNSMRNKLAIVDDAGRLVVRDLIEDTLMYQDSGVNSVAWNTSMESMLCYSHTQGGLSVRVGTIAPPRYPQNMLGVVVGLSGSTAFCLRGNVMNNVSLALGTTMWQFIEVEQFEDAYKVACLGVPDSDWKSLGEAALEVLELETARKAYVKLRDWKWIELIVELQEHQKRGDVPKQVIQADILAYSGKFKEAARLYRKAGHSKKALKMYSDLRMFDLAQEFLEEGDSVEKQELVRRRAEWAISANEPRVAADLLLDAGETEKAIEIVAEQGWTDVLLDIGRRVPQTDKKSLQLVASHLRRLQALPLASEIYRKMGEDTEVIQLHIEARDWTEAFRLAEQTPEALPNIHLQHARWLAESDQFIAAQEAYVLAGRPKEATKLLKDLADSAIAEERYADAGYYVWLRAKQVLKFMQDPEANTADDEEPPKPGDSLREFRALMKTASIYYAYSTIHSYLREPFTSNPPLTLFNTSRYVANQVEGSAAGLPKGVSLFAIFYTLSKQAKVLGANKLHLQINNKLQSLKPPPAIQDQVDINFILSRASSGGFNDPEELLPMCYKCSNYSTHLNANRCPNCQQEFIFSFVSFEILPLAELRPETDISDVEAERLLMVPPKENYGGSVDPFTDIMVNEEIGDLTPTTLDRDGLRAVDPRAVIIVRWPVPLRMKFYRNLLPELQISICPECRQAFHTEDYELQVLQKGHCPFCRATGDSLINSN